MAISDAKAIFGLSAIGTGERPWITQSASIGLTQTSVPLTEVTKPFVAELYLQGGDSATIDLSDFSTTIDAAAAVSAISTLTLTGNAVAAETVTVGDIAYTWRATVSTTANEVKIGATASDSLDNLIAAINAGAGSGTVYGSATTANAKATASAGTGDTMVATAVAIGELGNGVVTTEAMTNGSWSAASMTGGLNANSWTGAESNFEGDAFGSVGEIYGLLAYAEEVGFTIDSDSTTFNISVEAGMRVQLVKSDGMADIFGTGLTIAAAGSGGGGTLKIAIFGS